MKPDRRYLFQEHTIQCVSSFLPCDQYQQWDVNHKREVASHCPVSFIILFQTFKGKFTYAHTLSFFPIFLCSFHVQVLAICLNYYWLFLQFIIVPQDLPEGSRTKQKIETIEGDWRLPELESFNCKRPEEYKGTRLLLYWL